MLTLIDIRPVVHVFQVGMKNIHISLSTFVGIGDAFVVCDINAVPLDVSLGLESMDESGENGCKRGHVDSGVVVVVV